MFKKSLRELWAFFLLGVLLLDLLKQEGRLGDGMENLLEIGIK